MTAPEPIATGTLEKTPLPHLLVYLDQKKLSGTLALWPDGDGDPKGQDRLLLLKGVPVAARLIEPAATLRDGLLRLFARVRAPYAFYEGNLLGDDRVSGRVDPLSLITESLRSSARDEVVNEVLARFGNLRLRMATGIELKRYDFDAEERGLVELLQAEPASVAGLVRDSGLPEPRARRLVYLLAITKAVAPFDGSAAQQNARPRPLSEPKVAVPQVAAPPPPPPPPLADSLESMPPESLDPGPNSAPPPPVTPIAFTDTSSGNLHSRLDALNHIPQPPDGLSEAIRQRWMRVVTKGRLIENQNYFEMLELEKEAKAGEARSKFYQMAKEWHPDRLPPELAELREYVQIIFSYLSEASAVLGDEQQRLQYLQNVREGGGTPATERLMQSILDTAMEYERVLVLSRRHEYDEAIEVMKKILNVVKDEADYHTMYAWLLMQKFPGQAAPLAKILESVDRALELYDRHERANMLKGQVLRRMGKHDEALRYFRTVAEINPRNIEAVREVRVATMRTSTPPARKGKGKGKKGKAKEETGVGGLLGKIFKRD